MTTNPLAPEFSAMHRLLHAGSVAVIGASEDRGKFGGRLIYNRPSRISWDGLSHQSEKGRNSGQSLSRYCRRPIPAGRRRCGRPGATPAGDPQGCVDAGVKAPS